MPRRPDPALKVTLTCAGCGAAVTRYRSRVPLAVGEVCCSRTCVRAVKRQRREADRACVWCGTSFRPAFPAQRFCGYACRGRAQQERDPAIYFWPRVETTDGCWLWRGPLAKNGYGRVAFEGRREYTHRVSYRLAHGEIPPGLHVLHTCDVGYAPGDTAYRACVNPAHLHLGDQVTNNAERDARGRVAHGERHYAAILTARKAAAIRALYAQGGITQQKIAAVYGVSQQAIQRVVNGRDWRRV